MRKIGYWVVWFVFPALTAFECGNEEDCCAMPSCSEIASLDGTWRLDYFQNTATGAVDADPGISGKSVVFTFSDDEKNGTISGHTFVNTVNGAYTLYADCIFKITSFGGSKVGEPEWSRKAWLPSDSTGGRGSYRVQAQKLILKFDKNPEQLVFKKDK